MKTTFSLVLFLAALPVLALAQETLVPVSTNSVLPAVDASMQKQLPDFADLARLQLALEPLAKPTARVAGVDFTTKGAVDHAVRAGKIWQLLNPFAPAEYGHSYANVSVDPHTRQLTGIVLLSCRLGKARHHR